MSPSPSWYISGAARTSIDLEKLIKMMEFGIGTHLARKRLKDHGFWCSSQLLKQSWRRVVAKLLSRSGNVPRGGTFWKMYQEGGTIWTLPKMYQNNLQKALNAPHGAFLKGRGISRPRDRKQTVFLPTDRIWPESFERKAQGC